MLTQKQLVQILGNPESYNIEITSSTTNMDKFCQAICAFSNDLPGDDKSGYLIIGAEDNGKLSGLRVDDGLLLKMTNIRTDGNIFPTRRSSDLDCRALCFGRWRFTRGRGQTVRISSGQIPGTYLGTDRSAQKHRIGSRRKNIDGAKNL